MMQPIPKPNYCGQNWLEMHPTEGGRICRQCEKKMVDFSKASWAEIEKQQRQSDRGVCGMYNPKQLEYWGQEVPTRNTAFLKAIAITGLTMSFATASYGQKTHPSGTFVIEGKIIDETTSEKLAFVEVRLKNTMTGTLTDDEGDFRLVLSNTSSTSAPDTLEVNHFGYKSKQIILSGIEHSNRETTSKLNIALAPSTDLENVFYIPLPTPWQRVKWTLKKWFRWKEK